jgi:transposase
VIYVGIDWAEANHDVCVVDEAGAVVLRKRIADGLEGVAQFHAALAEHVASATEVVIGIETDRGLLVQALVAVGYALYAINPFALSRYRERHVSSGAKSDAGDAKALADLVRTDRHNHRRMAGDSELAEAVKVLARTHQSLIWARQRQANAMRNALREFYPGALEVFGADLASSDALAVLAIAPTPEEARTLSVARIVRALRAGGRKRFLERRARVIHDTLRRPQLAGSPVVSGAYGESVRSMARIVASLGGEIARLEQELRARFEQHPDAEILRSLPGLGLILGARVLGEFGDDPTRYADGRSRRCYAGSAPITKASGTKVVVLARVARNRRLADACYLWAFSAISRSDGARRYYDRQRARGRSHHQALRALSNRLVGILHGCLHHRRLYSEEIGWGSQPVVAA